MHQPSNKQHQHQWKQKQVHQPSTSTTKQASTKQHEHQWPALCSGRSVTVWHCDSAQCACEYSMGHGGESGCVAFTRYPDSHSGPSHSRKAESEGGGGMRHYERLSVTAGHDDRRRPCSGNAPASPRLPSAGVQYSVVFDYKSSHSGW